MIHQYRVFGGRESKKNSQNVRLKRKKIFSMEKIKMAFSIQRTAQRQIKLLVRYLCVYRYPQITAMNFT
jgi:hypothetical protein